MATSTIKRVVKFDGKTLQDLKGMSGNEMRQHYARIYPELSTATVEEETTATEVIITFTTGFKSKGHQG